MQEFIETFHVDWKIILAQLLNFGLVFLALYVLAAKPLRKIIKQRGEEISKGLSDAKAGREMLSKTQIEYDKMLTKARSEAMEIFENAKKEANLQKEEIIKKAHGEVDTMIENGKKNLEAEKNKMLEDVKKEVANLALLAAEKIMKGK